METDEIERIALAATDWLPDPAAAAAILIAGAALGMLLHRALFAALTRLVADRELYWRSLVGRGEPALRFALIVLGLTVASGIAPLDTGEAGIVRHALLVAFIGLVAWIAQTAINIWTTLHLRRFKLDTEDNLLARKHVTQTRILMRVVKVLLLVVALSAALMTFDDVRQYGVSLLASAGAAGIVVGLALQPVLTNLFAGIQLAITQPIRIDDAVIVEGEWGNVEEITATYVVIRLWDWRRLIVPLSYFITQPFQNWTRENAELIGTVMLYLDHSTPVDALRKAGEDFARASALWDGKVYALQVTDFRERVMEVRVLVSARTAPKAFDLRCEMRERLIGWLQAEHPQALPRFRGVIETAADGATPLRAAMSGD